MIKQLQKSKEEFDKEKYFIKDKVDGPQHYISGDEQGYLIPANEFIWGWYKEQQLALKKVVDKEWIKFIMDSLYNESNAEKINVYFNKMEL